MTSLKILWPLRRATRAVTCIFHLAGYRPGTVAHWECRNTKYASGIGGGFDGTLFLCLATWFVSNENRTYEASMANSGSGAEEKHNTLALGEATLVVTGSANATVLNGQALGKVPFTGKITPGTHALAVGQDGFETQKKFHGEKR